MHIRRRGNISLKDLIRKRKRIYFAYPLFLNKSKHSGRLSVVRTVWLSHHLDSGLETSTTENSEVSRSISRRLLRPLGCNLSPNKRSNVAFRLRKFRNVVRPRSRPAITSVINSLEIPMPYFASRLSWTLQPTRGTSFASIPVRPGRRIRPPGSPHSQKSRQSKSQKALSPYGQIHTTRCHCRPLLQQPLKSSSTKVGPNSRSC